MPRNRLLLEQQQQQLQSCGKTHLFLSYRAHAVRCGLWHTGLKKRKIKITCRTLYKMPSEDKRVMSPSETVLPRFGGLKQSFP